MSPLTGLVIPLGLPIKVSRVNRSEQAPCTQVQQLNAAVSYGEETVPVSSSASLGKHAAAGLAVLGECQPCLGGGAYGRQPQLDLGADTLGISVC